MGNQPRFGISRRGFIGTGLALLGGLTAGSLTANYISNSQENTQTEEYTYERFYESFSTSKELEGQTLTEEQKLELKETWNKCSPSLRKTACYFAENMDKDDDGKCLEFLEKEYTFRRFVQSLGEERTSKIDMRRLRKDWDENYSVTIRAGLCETYEGGFNELTDTKLFRGIDNIDVKAVQEEWNNEKAWKLEYTPNGEISEEDKIFFYLMEKLGPDFLKNGIDLGFGLKMY